MCYPAPFESRPFACRVESWGLIFPNLSQPALDALVAPPLLAEQRLLPEVSCATRRVRGGILAGGTVRSCVDGCFSATEP